LDNNEHPFLAGFVVGLITIAMMITVALFLCPELLVLYNFVMGILE